MGAGAAVTSAVATSAAVTDRAVTGAAGMGAVVTDKAGLVRSGSIGRDGYLRSLHGNGDSD